MQNYVKKWHSVSYFCFIGILVVSQEGTSWLVYNLREEVALFSGEENLVYSEHFCVESFITDLAHLTYFFEKLNALNTGMQTNNSNINAVTDEVKAFIRSWACRSEN